MVNPLEKMVGLFVAAPRGLSPRFYWHGHGARSEALHVTVFVGVTPELESAAVPTTTKNTWRDFRFRHELVDVVFVGWPGFEFF